MLRKYWLMWGELRARMEKLQNEKDSIDLEVLLAVMDNIEFIEGDGELEVRE
mgnify:CR=1 FL=1